MRKRHSLVVGGTRGIGRSLVKILSAEGGALSVIARHAPPESNRASGNVCYWPVDLLDDRGLSQVLSGVIDRNGKLNDVIFFQRYRGQGDDWSGEIATSLTATKKVIEFAADNFGGRERSIVIVSSINDRLIAPNLTPGYHVAKAGLTQMVRYYAVALGPKGIRVNAVSPGTVLKEESRDFFIRDRRLHNLYKRMVPLSRMGTSDEVAHVVAFLCSSKASFITGQNIVVDGGLSLRWQESLARELTSMRRSKSPQRS